MPFATWPGGQPGDCSSTWRTILSVIEICLCEFEHCCWVATRSKFTSIALVHYKPPHGSRECRTDSTFLTKRSDSPQATDWQCPESTAIRSVFRRADLFHESLGGAGTTRFDPTNRLVELLPVAVDTQPTTALAAERLLVEKTEEAFAEILRHATH